MSDPHRDGRRDAYKVLQVDPEADPDVIQAAYRRLAQKFHPDRAAGPEGGDDGRAAAERMVAINAAWEILRDPSRRAAYDRERAGGAGSGLESALRTGAAGSPQPASPPPAQAPSSGPSDPDRLSFGRYTGWTLADVLRADPGYLEWLGGRRPERPYKAEIEALLRRAGRAPTGTTRGLPRR